MLAEVAIRLENLRSEVGAHTGPLLDESTIVMRTLCAAAHREYSLAKALQRHTEMLSALQAPPEPGQETVVEQQARALRAAAGAMKQAHVDCTARLERAHPLRAELGRLFTDGSAMAAEATALLDELEAIGRSAEDLAKHAPDEVGHLVGDSFAPLLTSAAALRDAWHVMQERASVLDENLLPNALRLGSTPEHLSAQLVEIFGASGMPAADIVECLFADTERTAVAIYPQLQALRELVAAAAEGGALDANAGGAVAAVDNNTATSAENNVAALAVADTSGPAMTPVPANSTSSASVGTKGPKNQERNVHALTVLRRIKCKLDGKDRWPGRERETKQSVAEQVDTLVKQAIAVDNLCMVYEVRRCNATALLAEYIQLSAACTQSALTTSCALLTNEHNGSDLILAGLVSMGLG